MVHKLIKWSKWTKWTKWTEQKFESAKSARVPKQILVMREREWKVQIP